MKLLNCEMLEFSFLDGNASLNSMAKPLALHKKGSFPLKISSVNVTISAASCGFGHIY